MPHISKSCRVFDLPLGIEPKSKCYTSCKILLEVKTPRRIFEKYVLCYIFISCGHFSTYLMHYSFIQALMRFLMIHIPQIFVRVTHSTSIGGLNLVERVIFKIYFGNFGVVWPDFFVHFSFYKDLSERNDANQLFPHPFGRFVVIYFFLIIQFLIQFISLMLFEFDTIR